MMPTGEQRSLSKGKGNVRSKRGLRFGLYVLLLFILVACAKAPVTGRSQLILISPQEEKALGLKTAQEILKKEEIDTDPRLNQELITVGSRIARATGRLDFDWEFYLIFLASHPTDEARMKRLREFLPKARARFEMLYGKN